MYVPSPGVDQSQSQSERQSQHMVGPLKGAQGRKSTGWQLEASPSWGVARRRSRQNEASLAVGVAKMRRRQVKASMVSPPNTQG